MKPDNKFMLVFSTDEDFQTSYFHGQVMWLCMYTYIYTYLHGYTCRSSTILAWPVTCFLSLGVEMGNMWINGSELDLGL